MSNKRILTLAIFLLLAISAICQEAPDGYNPFVPVNLNDTAKLAVVPVVESSYHRYFIKGDQLFADSSEFVWYVENGTFGTYDTINDVWDPMKSLILGKGEFYVIHGQTIRGIKNASEIWVRWNDNTSDSTGYIAVYERSFFNCVVENQITGYKHDILPPPEMWFMEASREECSDEDYDVVLQFDNMHRDFYPYILTYSYPGSDGLLIEESRLLEYGDLNAMMQLTLNLPSVQDLTFGVDENYFITLIELRDVFGAMGKIAPLGPPKGQYNRIDLKVLHLPRTQGMTMDK